MTLCTEDSQTTSCLDFGRELDVGTTPCHIGSDGDDARLTCLGDDLSFLLVELSIEDVVRDLAQIEHLAQELRDLDRSRPYEYWTAFAYQANDLLDDSSVLLTSGLVDAVVEVVTCYGAVRGDDDDIKLIDVPEFACFGLCCTRHTRELVVHTEVVLQGDGGEGLGGSFDMDALLSFDRLVQAIGVAAAIHDTTRLFVNDHDLVVHDYILVILLKEGVGLEELVYGVDALTLDGVVGEQSFLALSELLG